MCSNIQVYIFNDLETLSNCLKSIKPKLSHILHNFCVKKCMDFF